MVSYHLKLGFNMSCKISVIILISCKSVETVASSIYIDLNCVENWSFSFLLNQSFKWFTLRMSLRLRDFWNIQANSSSLACLFILYNTLTVNTDMVETYEVERDMHYSGELFLFSIKSKINFKLWFKPSRNSDRNTIKYDTHAFVVLTYNFFCKNYKPIIINSLVLTGIGSERLSLWFGKQKIFYVITFNDIFTKFRKRNRY